MAACRSAAVEIFFVLTDLQGRQWIDGLGELIPSQMDIKKRPEDVGAVFIDLKTAKLGYRFSSQRRDH